MYGDDINIYSNMENGNEDELGQSTAQLAANEYYAKYEDDLTMKIDVPACSLKQLFRYADRIDVVLMVVGTLFSLGNGVSLMFYAQPFGKLVNAFAPGKDSQEIVNDALESVKLFAINSAIVFINSWFMSAAWAITSERQMIRARKAYFASLMNQEIAWHDRNRPAQACSKMYIEISKVHQGIINNVTSILTKVSLGLSGIIIALVRGWQMALVMISFLPVMMTAGYVSSIYIKKIQKFQQKTKARFDSDVIEVFDNIRTVRMLDGERYETKRYLKTLKKSQEETTKNSIKNKICFAVFFFCILMNYSLGFWYGAKLVSEQTINTASNQPYSVADVIIIFFTLYMSNLSLSGLPESITSFNISRVSMTRVCLMIDRQSRVKDGSQIAPKSIKAIVFDGVCFRYQKPLFNNFNFKIKPGLTALIGESGSGKTTIINLILRFYDIFGGRVYFETKEAKFDLNQLSFDSLRERIGYVGQEPVLIGKTLKQALTAEDVPQAQIIALLKKVKAWDFVKDIGLDNEYAILSGGQKQRIAIARALIRNPQILILDEGTSALDRTTQQQVLNSIRKMNIPFVLMIAHRMETVITADNIVKLEKGSIAAEGTYEQLVEQGVLSKIESKEDDDQSPKLQLHESLIIKQKKQKQEILKIIQKQGSKAEQQEEKVDKEQKQFHMSYICRLMAFNKKLWYLYLIGIVGSFFIGAIFPTFAYLLSNILVTLTGIAYEKDPNQLTVHQQQVRALSISLFLISLGSLVIVILRGVSFTYLTENLGEYLKKSAFRTSVTKSMIDIDAYGAQNLGHIVTTNCEDLKHLGGHHLGDIVENATTILVGLAIAFAFSWQITLIALGVFPLIILSGKLQMSFNHGMQSNSDKVHKKTHESVIESIMHIRTVKSLNLQHRIISKYSQALDEALKLAVKYGNLAGVMFGLGQTLISCLLSLIFFFGALLIKEEVVTVLNLYTAIYAIMFAGVQAGGNMLFLGKLSAAKYAACNYFEVIASDENEPLEHSVYISNNRISDYNSESSHKIKGDIELNDVEFKYANRDQSIFKHFSLKIKKGQKVALVGESGSGKSTITNIIFRIYEPVSGEVLIDGENISTYNLSELRRQLGIVSQEPALFNRSIYENIKYNCKNATFEDVVHASKMAKAYDFIVAGNFGMKDQTQQEGSEETQNEQPQTQEQMGAKVKGADHVKIEAFNKKVGTKGSYLSGGQKQRIAIARALVRNPSVIVLDEATSALDNENQKMVQEAIEGIKGVTQIIIAHRLSTVEHCDKIVVMKKGRIVEEGGYHQLLKRGGYFYKLVNAVQESEKASNSSILIEPLR